MQASKWLLAMLALVAVLALMAVAAADGTGWSKEQIAQLRELSIANLPPPPADPSNRVADDARAAELGHRLFFDERLSANGQVACATCHLPDKLFQDGTPLAKGVGTTDRRTMSIIGTAHSPWQFWDGRKDSQWAQALGPLESAVEHGGDRTQYVRLLAREYRADYEAIFGPLPDLSGLPAHGGPVQDARAQAAWNGLPAQRRDAVSAVFANMGKAIAAYERRIEPGASRFDQYVEAAAAGDRQRMRQALTGSEIAGLQLFLGKAQCVQCHGGPLLTNQAFHNTGVPAAAGLPPDRGRLAGATKVLQDEFNCLGRFSDAKPDQCGEIRFLVENSAAQLRQFRVPSLRNVAQRGPYMHAGQFATLKEVVQHYNAAPAAPEGHSELKPLGLSDREVEQLVAFLATLSGPVRADAKWLKPPTPTLGGRGGRSAP
jgi:cytochrome c peroxidase